jgi:hypothetical protein
MERKTLMSASRNIWKSGKLPVTGTMEKEWALIKTAFFNTAADRPGMQRVTALPRAGLRPARDLMGCSTQTGKSSGGD